MAYNDMPDVGTLGGTMQGEDGESSVTLGGGMSPDQSWANNDFNFEDFLSTDLASMYSQGSPSTGVYANPLAPNTTPFNSTMASINDFFNNNRFGKIAGTLMNFTPVGRAVNVARGVGTMLGQGNMLGAGATALGAFGGVPGAVVNAGYQASRGNVAPGVGLATGMATGNPLAAFGASTLAGQFQGRGGTPGINGNVPNQGGESGFNAEGLAGGLAQIYAASQANSGLKGASGANQAVQDQISSLSGMYGPNSPYAAQLRQTLERKDAAAGRRSQYGPREVQLMAALADKQAGVADSIGRLATNGQANQIALNNQKNQTRAQQLALLMNLGKQSGAFTSLGNMFKQPQPEVNYDDSTWMGSV